ncbi:MAG: deoxyribodipyrimidine photo-lyase [Rikenellaceae bacterium]|nr:deoxyribodipyrimidine photo-lyase [Rikenellaceae bacterium]
MEQKSDISLFWFRRDLRLDDNCGLYHALRSGHKVLPVFVFDTGILGKLTEQRDKRVAFIYSSILNLKREIEKQGSTLLVLYGSPVDVFRSLLEKYNIVSVYANHDYEPYSINRDKSVGELLKGRGVTFRTFKDQVIFEKSDVVKSDGSPYTVFTPYSKAWKAALQRTPLTEFPSQLFLDSLYKTEQSPLPDIREIGFLKCDTMAVNPLIREDIITNYHKNKDLPSVEGTSNLGIYLRFGRLSIRKIVSLALRLNESWLNELIWREFFMMIIFNYPYVVDTSFKKKYDLILWRNDEEEFQKWCTGMTGFPMVDAGMRQLNQTGLMHNRVRMVAASFLTKHLLIDWRAGESYFASKLLDYELSSNNGNWQWASGSGCDAAPYFRIFNPYEQQRRFDPDMVYVKRWIPEYGTPDYPLPFVDHTFARDRALRAYRELIS